VAHSPFGGWREHGGPISNGSAHCLPVSFFIIYVSCSVCNLFHYINHHSKMMSIYDLLYTCSCPSTVRMAMFLPCHHSCKQLHSFMLCQQAQQHQLPEPLQYPEDQYTSCQGWYDAQEDIWYDAPDCTEDELEDEEIWYDARDGTKDEACCVSCKDQQHAFQQLLHMLRPGQVSNK
jgi:hypothetical protein